MTLEKYLDDRETWQNNTIEEIKKKVIYKPKSLKNSRVGEKLVAIYGPPQIGKTTLILCLIGIAPEFQKKVYNDIRAGVPRGNSSTSTIGDRLYKGGLFSRSAKQSDFVDLIWVKR